MNLTIYQVDAFTSKQFSGNPAAVIPLLKWHEEALLQRIAMENNLSETVYFVAVKNGYEIRWFTPTVEVNLCGHATLAAGYILYNFLDYKFPTLHFHSKSGELILTKNDGLLTMDFPSWPPQPVTHIPALLSEGLGTKAFLEVRKYREYLVELADEAAVKAVTPDFRKLVDLRSDVIITAKGNDCDFVSRFFAPGSGIDEDPVTGSAHSQLIPYWSSKLLKNNLYAKQLSQRGGELWCEQVGDRVKMGGHCVFYMKGEIQVTI